MNVGQFMPCSTARPALGHPGKLQFVEEDRVEVVVNDQGGSNFQLKGILKELKEVGILVYFRATVPINNNVIDFRRRSIRMKRSRTTCIPWRHSDQST